MRWLAELCGLPSAPYYPELASAVMANGEHMATALQHIAWWSRHPDAGSQFARAIRDLPDTSDASRVAALRALGYDGLLYWQHSKIIGHVFFQRHGSALHGFSCWADETLRGRVFFRVAVMDFLAHASQCPDIVRARAGGGHYPITTLVLTRLRRVADRLGWRLHDDGWIDFSTQDSDGAAGDPAPSAPTVRPR